MAGGLSSSQQPNKLLSGILMGISLTISMFETVFPCFYVSLNPVSQFTCSNGLQASLRLMSSVSVIHPQRCLEGKCHWQNLPLSTGSQVAVSQNVHKAAAPCLTTSACSGNQSLRERWLECSVPAQSPTGLCLLASLVFVYFSKPCESVYLLQWASGMSAVSESYFGYPPLVMSWGKMTFSSVS